MRLSISLVIACMALFAMGYVERSVVAARQSMHNTTDDSPYDAEVDYLESTGTQWIDTGVVATFENETSAWIDVILTSLRGASSGTLALTGANTAYNNGFSISHDSYRIRGSYGTLTTSEYSPSVGTRFQVAVSKYEIVVNGTSYVISPSNSGFLAGSVILFGLRRGANVQAITLASCKIYGARFSQAGSLIRDFIPVRFTNELGQSEGAMYDRVSSELFRNMGSGEFLIGPDRR